MLAQPKGTQVYTVPSNLCPYKRSCQEQEDNENLMQNANIKGKTFITH
jgi:hypothetical protein